jgi:hypothetical protein
MLGLEEEYFKPEKSDCKGLYFRGYRNFYQKRGNVHLRQGVKFLKRMSCTGCSKCGWYHDTINEQMDCDGVLMPEIEDGKLYSVMITNESTDWESGCIDSYDFEFFEVEETK